LKFADGPWAAVNVPLFDGLQYIASYGDLILFYRANARRDPAAVARLGVNHYTSYGYNEDRSPGDFDAALYKRLNPDLSSLTDAAATLHYITDGYR
jgi:hypothetical protein